MASGLQLVLIVSFLHSLKFLQPSATSSTTLRALPNGMTQVLIAGGLWAMVTISFSGWSCLCLFIHRCIWIRTTRVTQVGHLGSTYILPCSHCMKAALPASADQSISLNKMVTPFSCMLAAGHKDPEIPDSSHKVWFSELLAGFPGKCPQGGPLILQSPELWGWEGMWLCNSQFERESNQCFIASLTDLKKEKARSPSLEQASFPVSPWIPHLYQLPW